MKQIFHDHWDMMIAGTSVLGASLVWLWRTVMSKYATKDDLRECYEMVRREVKDLNDSNTKQHEEIMGHIINHLNRRD